MASGCASTPKPHPKVDLAWEFIEVTPFEDGKRACLKMADVQKLREMQLRCEAK